MNPPGWYPDPSAPELLRWWDGTAWTAQTAPRPPATAPGAAPNPGATAAPGPQTPPSRPASPPQPGLPGPPGAAPTWAPGPGAPGPSAASAAGSRRGFVIGAVALAFVLLLALVGGGVLLAKRSNDVATPPATTAAPTTAGPGGDAGNGTTKGSAKTPTTPTTKSTPTSEKQTTNENQSLAERTQAAGIPLLSKEAFATHTHTLVKIVVDGEQQTIPAGIGIDERAGKIAAVHTHADTGVVHVESPTEDDVFTIGQFLTMWGKGADDEALCASIAQSTGCRVSIDVVDPTTDDQDTFSDFGTMPDRAPEKADGYDTGLVQGAVIVVSIDTK